MVIRPEVITPDDFLHLYLCPQQASNMEYGAVFPYRVEGFPVKENECWYFARKKDTEEYVQGILYRVNNDEYRGFMFIECMQLDKHSSLNNAMWYNQFVAKNIAIYADSSRFFDIAKEGLL